jgi:transglutaminase-like putative cysteine protease
MFISKQDREPAEPIAVRRELSKEQLAGYRQWKQEVPADLRSLVEGYLLGRRVKIDKDDLPPVVEFHHGLRQMLEKPQADTSALGLSIGVQKQFASLQRIKIGDEHVNLFAALADPDIGFDVKTNYVRTKLLPRLEFLRSRDERLMREAIEKKSETDVTGEDEEEEYSPHRGPAQEQVEGLPSEAIATVAPFYGGYFMDDVYDRYDPVTLTWKKSPRRMSEVGEQRLDIKRRRVYRSRLKNGRGKVKLPRGWGVDIGSVKGLVERDQDGIVRVRIEDEASGEFSIQIAPSPDALTLAPPKGETGEIPDAFPDEVLAFAQEALHASIPEAAKARRIASFIHTHLEYDQDSKWEAVYKADPSRYFEAIWENKKAKCDEANSLLVRLLTRFGVHARFIGGHSARVRSETGEAMLLDSNRHAWAYVWDHSARKWERLDATPAGDPNVDQDEQQAELCEGDYGDQEAEYMSEKELDKRLEEQKLEKPHPEQEDPILRYAREAECSPEEARAILEKIETLRKLYASVLVAADRQWQKLVRENVREAIVDHGPVSLSKMDEIDPDELVSGYIEIMAGEKDPLIGERAEMERKKEKWFGGYDVYVAVDMSGSMNETLSGVKKSDAQRDMAFLLVDSCMNAAVTARKNEHKLTASMPVRVSVVVLGKKTEIVLPLTGDWTPKEQITLYRALDAGAGGGTPDHQALALIEQQIAVSLREQDERRKQKPSLQKHGWKTRRFVLATADGGSDSPRAVKQANARLTQMGIPVDLFLIGPEGDEHLLEMAQAAYPSVTPISDPGKLAEIGLKRLTQRIKEVYANTRN